MAGQGSRRIRHVITSTFLTGTGRTRSGCLTAECMHAHRGRRRMKRSVHSARSDSERRRGDDDQAGAAGCVDAGADDQALESSGDRLGSAYDDRPSTSLVHRSVRSRLFEFARSHKKSPRRAHLTPPTPCFLPPVPPSTPTQFSLLHAPPSPPTTRKASEAP